MGGPGIRKLRGFVIYRSPVREKDRIIEAYTREEGLIRFYAPGVSHVASKRAGHVELFFETQIVLARSRSGRDSLAEAKTIKAFPRMRESIESLDAAYGIAKFIRSNFSQGHRDALAYDAVIRAVSLLDAGKITPYAALGAAKASLLRCLGVMPDLRLCAACGKRLLADSFSFARREKRFVCADCGGRSDSAATGAVKYMRLLLDSPEKTGLIRVPVEVRAAFDTIVRNLEN